MASRKGRYPRPSSIVRSHAPKPRARRVEILSQSATGNSAIAPSRMEKGRTPLPAANPTHGLGRTDSAITRRLYAGASDLPVGAEVSGAIRFTRVPEPTRQETYP